MSGLNDFIVLVGGHVEDIAQRVHQLEEGDVLTYRRAWDRDRTGGAASPGWDGTHCITSMIFPQATDGMGGYGYFIRTMAGMLEKYAPRIS